MFRLLSSKFQQFYVEPPSRFSPVNPSLPELFNETLTSNPLGVLYLPKRFRCQHAARDVTSAPASIVLCISG